MAAIYINGKLCSGGTELVEEVQEGLTEAVTSDAVARYIKPVVQNVTSGVTNPVSSGAVYGALTEYDNKILYMAKRYTVKNSSANSINLNNLDDGNFLAIFSHAGCTPGCVMYFILKNATSSYTLSLLSTSSFNDHKSSDRISLRMNYGELFMDNIFGASADGNRLTLFPIA